MCAARDALLAMASQVVPVQIDGATLHVRPLTFGEYRVSQEMMATLPKDAGLLVSVLFCACDDQGNRLFNNDELHVVERLPLRVLDALNQAAARLITFDPDAEKKS